MRRLKKGIYIYTTLEKFLLHVGLGLFSFGLLLRVIRPSTGLRGMLHLLRQNDHLGMKPLSKPLSEFQMQSTQVYKVPHHKSI